jgi:hypothetical protein
VKFRLLISLIFIIQLAHGQPPPAGYAQVYVYGEREKLPAGGNYTNIVQADDGSLITHAYSRDWFRLRNTSQTPLRTGKSLYGIQNAQLLPGYTSPEWFYLSDKSLVQLKADSFFTRQGWEKPIAMMIPYGKHIVAIMMKDNRQYVEVFDGKSWKPLQLPLGAYTYPQYYLYAQSDRNGTPMLAIAGGQTTDVHKYDSLQNKLIPVASYDIKLTGGNGLLHFADTSHFIFSKDGRFFTLQPGKGNKPIPSPDIHLIANYSGQIIYKKKGFSTIFDPWITHQNEIPLATEDRLQGIIPDKFGPGYFVGSAGSLFRVFPYIRQYPKLYNQSHTKATHCLMQTEDGTMFAGSFTGQISAIYQNKVIPIQATGSPLLPGGVGLGNRIYYFQEKVGHIGSNTLNKQAGKIPISELTTGFYIRPSPNGKQVFAGFAGARGFGIIEKADFIAGKNSWRYIDSTRGMRLYNVLTVTEDPLGRLWFARSSEGWGVYDTATDKAITFRIADGETSFGAMASALDNKGTIWLGGSHGLWYYDARQKALPTPAAMQRFGHPLVPAGEVITSITTWKQYLVVGIGKRVLLIDLHDFYTTQKSRQKKDDSFTKVRYLNPHELDLTAELEQNIFVVDNKDSSLWLATNNNVYNIDLLTWLNLPTYIAKPTISLIAGNDTFNLQENKPIDLAPTSNSLQMQVIYQTRDNMPRFIQVALQAEGDTLRWTTPDIDHTINAYNRQTGTYTIFVRIFQQDGTVTTHSFPIKINRFWWQQWWFWLLVSLAMTGIAIYIYYLHKQKQLAQANVARLAAEAVALKAEQQRQLTSMQVKSLGTQFRPHFILNALNTIGAQLYDKPEVDAVLGQLGDSIGIIFRNAQSGSIAHPLSEEWKLVESVIKIKQMELGNTVQLHYESANHYCMSSLIQVPMGILQIPIENALVHGLRNKETGVKNLWIELEIGSSNNIMFIIRDNGIGRKAAAAMSNYRSNGVGSRNLQAIIDLLNPLNTKSITIEIVDLPIEEHGNMVGTQVNICIPKTYYYGV